MAFWQIYRSSHWHRGKLTRFKVTTAFRRCVLPSASRSGDNGIMQPYEDEAIVLLTHKLGEADRIITLLTREHGKVRAVAKGVRKPTSKFGGRLEPFMVINAQIRPGRNLDIVAGADTVHIYADPISRDYPKFVSAAAIIETADHLTNADPGSDQYFLLRGALASVARGSHTPELVRSSYILRALSLAGWAPQFDQCARCERSGPFTLISIERGGAVCDECATPGLSRVGPDTVALLSALVRGDWAVADASAEIARAEAAGIVAAYLQHVLERRVSSLAIS